MLRAVQSSWLPVFSSALDSQTLLHGTAVALFYHVVVLGQTHSTVFY